MLIPPWVAKSSFSGSDVGGLKEYWGPFSVLDEQQLCLAFQKNLTNYFALLKQKGFIETNWASAISSCNSEIKKFVMG